MTERRPLVLLLLAALLSGCAMTSGSTFSGVVSAVEAGSDESKAETDSSGIGPPAAGDGSFALQILTNPDDATVTIDGRERGSTPLTIDSIEPGRYSLEVTKPGYYVERRRIQVVPGQSLVVEVDLELIVGFVDITVNPADASLSINGESAQSGVQEVPIGDARIRARRFGYLDETVRVRVEERQTTRVTIELGPAPFEATGFAAFRQRFNPRSPGATGTTSLSYVVTAPGDGRILIRDSAGIVVRELVAGRFDTWEQRELWDGRDSLGEIVPDDTYLVEAILRGDDGTDITLTTSVTVDSSITISYASIWGAAPGLLYVPLPEALAQAWTQLSIQGTGIITRESGSLVTRFPLRLGARIGLGAGLEVGAYAGVIAHSNPLDDRFQAGGSISWSPNIFGEAPLELGVIAGGMYQSASETGSTAAPDTQAGAPGFFASLPVTVGSSLFKAVIAPEYRLSYAPVVYGSGALPENSFGSLAYLRVGFASNVDSFRFGMSAALRTARFSGGLALDPPIPVGLEAHWILPNSPVALSAYVAGEFDSLTDFYVMSGAGIGVLF